MSIEALAKAAYMAFWEGCKEPVLMSWDSVSEDIKGSYAAMVYAVIEELDKSGVIMRNNSVVESDLIALLDHADTEEQVFFGKTLVVTYQLDNGFVIVGKGSCVDPANFNLDKGRMIARADALNQLWVLEGYKLQDALYVENR